MTSRPVVTRLAARLWGQLWDPDGVPVVSITITHIGDLWNPAHLVLTARQSEWLVRRLSVPAPPGMDDPGVCLPATDGPSEVTERIPPEENGGGAG
jgi:hypothetical protein